MTIKESAKKSKEHIPTFLSHEEEAKFWDTHDFADYWEQWEPVKVRFAKNLSENLNIRLDSKTIEELRKRAQSQGIGPTTLARMWILAHLQD